MPSAPAPAPALRRAAARAALWLLDRLMPPRCPACDARVGETGGLCAACWARLPLIERPYCERLGTPFPFDAGEGLLSPEAIAHPPAYGRARAACRYDGVAVDLVHRLKYGDRPELAPLLAGLMARAARELLPTVDLVVPVPLHGRRLWARRFNQSALLAGCIAKGAGLPHDPFVLVRRRPTRQQVGLSRAERARNVRAAFAVPPGRRAALQGRRVLVVDDVLTSGATLEAVTRTLRRAGAASVDVLVFARVVQAD